MTNEHAHLSFRRDRLAADRWVKWPAASASHAGKDHHSCRRLDASDAKGIDDRRHLHDGDQQWSGRRPVWLMRERRFQVTIPGGRPLSAYVLGTAFAFGWTPCIGPVLGGILTLGAASATVSGGATLLGVYSLGLGIPFIASAMFVDRITFKLRTFGRTGRLLQFTTGGVMVLAGVAMMTGQRRRTAEIPRPNEGESSPNEKPRAGRLRGATPRAEVVNSARELCDDEDGVARWQDRITPVWKHVAGGCHLNRKPDDLMRSAGFVVEALETGYLKGPRPMGFVYAGSARAA
jgi:hypothetical protein